MISNDNRSSPLPDSIARPLQTFPWTFDNSGGNLDQRPTIKVPPMAPSTRSATRQRTGSLVSGASGSEYHESNVSMDPDDTGDIEQDEDLEPQMPKVKPVFTTSQRGRRVQKKSYVESASEEDGGDPDNDEIDLLDGPAEGRVVNGAVGDDDQDEESEGIRTRLKTRSRTQVKLSHTIMSEEEGDEEAEVFNGRYATRSRGKRPNGSHSTASPRSRRISKRRNGNSQPLRPSRLTRSNSKRQSAQDVHDADIYDPSSGDPDADGSMDDVPSSPDPEPEEDLDPIIEVDREEEAETVPDDGKPYALRQRAKINYAIPPPLEEMRAPPPKPKPGGRANGRGGFGNRRKGPGWSASGAELSRWMGAPAGDDSVSTLATYYQSGN